MSHGADWVKEQQDKAAYDHEEARVARIKGDQPGVVARYSAAMRSVDTFQSLFRKAEYDLKWAMERLELAEAEFRVAFGVPAKKEK